MMKRRPDRAAIVATKANWLSTKRPRDVVADQGRNLVGTVSIQIFRPRQHPILPFANIDRHITRTAGEADRRISAGHAQEFGSGADQAVRPPAPDSDASIRMAR